MLLRAYLLLILVTCISHIYAQGKDDLETRYWELSQFNVIKLPILSDNNKSAINQVGTEHNLTVMQEHQGTLSNSVLSAQFDFDNSAYIEQIGSGHLTVLVQQGTGNEANAWSVGDKTLTGIYQSGTDNNIHSYIDNHGILPKANILIQQGSGNDMQIALLGNGDRWYQRLPKAMDVRQYGESNQIELILEHSILPGIKVTQIGGHSIAITHSAFSFPMKKY